MKEHFRGIVMPKQLTTLDGYPPIVGKDGKPIYRYLIAGLLCTDEPISNFQRPTKNKFRAEGEFCLDGCSTLSLAKALSSTPTVPGPELRFGTIGSEVTNLDTWPDEYDTAMECWHCNASVDTYDEVCKSCGGKL